MLGDFGAPTDPAYTRFLDGFKQVAADPAGKASWHWHAGDGKWYVYDPAQWGLEDLRLADTPPETALHTEWGFPNSKYEVVEMFVPDLFKRLAKAAATYSARFPKANLVWSPWDGGDWRSAFKRGTSPEPPDGGWDPPPLSRACLQRIEDTKENERRGLITHDQARLIIRSIIANCPD